MIVHACVVVHVHAGAHMQPTQFEKNIHPPRSQASANNDEKDKPRGNNVISFDYFLNCSVTQPQAAAHKYQPFMKSVSVILASHIRISAYKLDLVCFEYIYYNL